MGAFRGMLAVTAAGALLLGPFVVRGHCESTEAPQNNVILFGWDGAQREHVKECLGRGELPALQSIAAQGSIVEIDALRVTDTKAGWSQILTGCNPETSGIFSNGRYGPIPAGMTIFERLEDYFGKDNITTVAVIGKKGHVDADGPKKFRETARTIRRRSLLRQRRAEGKVVVEEGIRYREIPAKPYFNAKDNMDLFINGLGENQAVGEKAIELLEQCRDSPFFFFVHFADVDHKGHKFGENSAEYNEALISCDRWTGEIVKKVREMGLEGKTTFYVTADHGFDEDTKGHADAPYVFLASSDPAIIRRGERADIAATILEKLGIPPAEGWPLDGHTLTRPYEAPKW